MISSGKNVQIEVINLECAAGDDSDHEDSDEEGIKEEEDLGST